MCQQRRDRGHGRHAKPPLDDDGSFPWHLGVFDAHCHPTDTMASVACLPGMRAARLAIMATRSQDQHLVAEVAVSHGGGGGCDYGGGTGGRCTVVPSFGWHPWFSHQLYDDSAPEPTYKPSSSSSSSSSSDNDDEAKRKAAHYQAVLSPPPQDPAFLSSLPVPTPLSAFIAATRQRLDAFPQALVGEIGLDKAFRLPQPWDHHPSSDASSSSSSSSSLSSSSFDASACNDGAPTPGGREGRLLSPYRVRVQHQQAVLRAQLRLAGEAGRPVSVHGVQAHGVLYDTVSACWKGHECKVLSRREKKMVAPGAEEGEDEDEDEDDQSEHSNDEDAAAAAAVVVRKKKTLGGKPFPPRICLHSYSGAADMLKQWLHPSVPADVFVSLSTAVNLGTPGGKAKLADVVRAVPDDRILVESDLHVAGEEMEAALEDMYRLVCEIKGWEVEDGVRRIGGNFGRFVYG